MIKFKITAGDAPTLSDTLTTGGPSASDTTDAAINLTSPPAPSGPVNLSGCTVQLLMQGPGVNYSVAATIMNTADGMVQCQLTPTQTAVPGVYRAEWQITDASGNVTTARPFEFEIRPGLPVTPPTSLTKLSDFYDDIRALTGDFDKRLYQDSQIASVMRTQLRLGRVKTGDCVTATWLLGPDGQTINPAIGPTDVLPYSLLVYHSAHTLILPNVNAYSYRTRALSERFGEAKDFLFTLQETLYELQNGEQTFANITGLRSWLFAVNGLWVWSYMQANRDINLSFH